jgi:hypothetical protein
LAEQTRKLVNDQVGSFSRLKRYLKNPNEAPTTAVRAFATSIHQTVTVQAVEGDAGVAEDSSIRINSTAVPISKAELTLIQSRDLPARIATRALMHAGEGFEYWRQFAEPIRKQIEEDASLIYTQLIKPINDYPVLALDLPAPKRGYSANSMQTVLDMLTILNRNPNAKKPGTPTGDIDGSKTVEYLERVRKLTELVFGNKHSGSLALHPALYCYDSRGERPHLMNQIEETQRSGGSRGVLSVVELYKQLLSGLENGNDESQIIQIMRSNQGLKFLDWAVPQEVDTGKRFSDAATAAAVIKLALECDICPECEGRSYIKDRSKDHKVRLEDGGTSVPSNLELKHPYCNSGYKERLNHHLTKMATDAQA